MPIDGLTNRGEKRFPRLGKIKKGIRVPSKSNPNKMVPKDTDHFVFQSDNAEVKAILEAVFGAVNSGRMVHAYVNGRTTDEVLTAWVEVWGKSGLKHRCDRKRVYLERNEAGILCHVDKPCEYNGAFTPEHKPVGRIDLIIPELVQAGYVGYVTLETHSQIDIAELDANLRAVEAMRDQHPLGLKGIEFTIYRVEQDVSFPVADKPGERAMKKRWMLKMVPSQTWVLKQIEAASMQQMLLAGETAQPLQLEAGQDDDAEDVETDDHLEDAEEPAVNGEFEEEDDEEPAPPPAPVATAKPAAQTPGNGGNGKGAVKPAASAKPAGQSLGDLYTSIWAEIKIIQQESHGERYNAPHLTKHLRKYYDVGMVGDLGAEKGAAFLVALKEEKRQLQGMPPVDQQPPAPAEQAQGAMFQ